MEVKLPLAATMNREWGGYLPLSGVLGQGTHIHLDDFPSDIVVRSLHKTVTVHLVWVDMIEKF